MNNNETSTGGGYSGFKALEIPTKSTTKKSDVLRDFTINLFNKLVEFEKMSETRVDGLTKQIEDFKTKQTDELIKLDSRLNESESKTTEILAIFITLFTFISINVNIFTRVSDLHTAIYFLLLITICSIILVSFLFIIGYDKKISRITWFGLFASLLILIGLLVTTRYTNWNPKLNTPVEIQNK